MNWRVAFVGVTAVYALALVSAVPAFGSSVGPLYGGYLQVTNTTADQEVVGIGYPGRILSTQTADQRSFTDLSVADNNCCSESAAYDLSRGLLRAYTTSNQSETSGAWVDYFDTLTFGQSGLVPFSLTVSGLVSDNPAVNKGNYSDNIFAWVYQDGVIEAQLVQGSQPAGPPLDTATITGDLNVTAGTPTLLDVSLEIDASQGATVDFTHTAFLNFNLGAGQSFTSASGVFLTNPVTASAPEPISLSLFVSGLAGVAAVRRRQRAAT
jgi:hypothetical protein